jgi:hypothetical protein
MYVRAGTRIVRRMGTYKKIVPEPKLFTDNESLTTLERMYYYIPALLPSPFHKGR